ncbi:hypothetical protein B7463_g10929, partial [Scytalidium lignicola]
MATDKESRLTISSSVGDQDVPVIPKTCKAGVVKEFGPNFKVVVEDVAIPEPGPDEVLLRLNVTGICYSDLHYMLEDLPMPRMSDFGTLSPGHEGAGVVVKVGSNVKGWKVGDRGGVKPMMDVCQNCEHCWDRRETYCTSAISTGLMVNGTYQQYITSPARYTSRIPDGVDDFTAGPIMCSGSTMYQCLEESQLKPGEWVVFMGAGGGVGHMGVQIAKAMGLRVIGVDGGKAKRDLCMQLGCEAFVDFASTDDLVAEVVRITEDKGAHGVIVTAGNRSAYGLAPSMLRIGGVVMCVGLPPTGTTIAGADPTEFALKGIRITGTLVGSMLSTDKCLQLAKRGLVKPIYEIFSIAQLPEAVDKLRQGKVSGRHAKNIVKEIGNNNKQRSGLVSTGSEYRIHSNRHDEVNASELQSHTRPRRLGFQLAQTRPERENCTGASLPSNTRAITAIYHTLYYIGSVLAAWTTFGTRNYDNNWAWRIPSVLQIAIPLVTSTGLFFCPESPRWLISQERHEEARAFFVKYHADGDVNSPLVAFQIDEITENIQRETAAHKSTSYLDMLRTKGNRHRLLISISIGVFAQWNGVGIVSYYLSIIFHTVGVTSVTQQTLINGFLQLWNLIMAVFAEHHNSATGIAVVPMLFIYDAFYDFSYTPLVVAYPAEIWPYELRSCGIAISQMANFGALFFNAFVNSIALANIAWKYYIVYIGILILICITIYFFYPETRAMSLEEIAEVFDKIETESLGTGLATNSEIINAEKDEIEYTHIK